MLHRAVARTSSFCPHGVPSLLVYLVTCKRNATSASPLYLIAISAVLPAMWHHTVQPK